MPDDHVALVTEIARISDAAGHAASTDLFAAHAHPDVIWQEDPYWPDAGTYCGAEETARLLDARTDSLRDHEDRADRGLRRSCRPDPALAVLRGRERRPG